MSGIQLAVIAVLTLTCFFLNASAQNIDFAAIEAQTVKVADGLYVLMEGASQGNIWLRPATCAWESDVS